jgi:hypothetical protein
MTERNCFDFNLIEAPTHHVGNIGARGRREILIEE